MTIQLICSNIILYRLIVHRTLIWRLLQLHVHNNGSEAGDI